MQYLVYLMLFIYVATFSVFAKGPYSLAKLKKKLEVEQFSILGASLLGSDDPSYPNTALSVSETGNYMFGDSEITRAKTAITPLLSASVIKSHIASNQSRMPAARSGGGGGASFSSTGYANNNYSSSMAASSGPGVSAALKVSFKNTSRSSRAKIGRSFGIGSPTNAVRGESVTQKGSSSIGPSSASPTSLSEENKQSAEQDRVLSYPIVVELKTGTTINSSELSTDEVFDSGVEQKLYLAAVAFYDASNSVDHIEGMGLSWNRLASKDSMNSTVRLEIWYANGTALSSTAVTAYLSSSVDAAQLTALSYFNVDFDDPIEFLGDSAPDFNSKNVDYIVTTSRENVRVFSAIGYLNLASFSAETFSATSSISSGTNPTGTGLVVMEKNFASADSYSVAGEFAAAVKWSSIAIAINPAD